MRFLTATAPTAVLSEREEDDAPDLPDKPHRRPSQRAWCCLQRFSRAMMKGGMKCRLGLAE
jgi:hypothetical protein